MKNCQKDDLYHLQSFTVVYLAFTAFTNLQLMLSTDKQNALRRECTLKIEKVLDIGVAGVNIYLKITVLALSDVLARLAQSVRPWRIGIDFYQ